MLLIRFIIASPYVQVQVHCSIWRYSHERDSTVCSDEVDRALKSISDSLSRAGATDLIGRAINTKQRQETKLIVRKVVRESAKEELLH